MHAAEEPYKIVIGFRMHRMTFQLTFSHYPAENSPGI